MSNQKHRLILLVILLFATLFRFYNLMFDAPYFFNPDERNMANAITQFRLPEQLSLWPACIAREFDLKHAPERVHTQLSPQSNCNLNPHFFAYGQFPLYLSFFSDQITQRVTPHEDSFFTQYAGAIFWLRFYSALTSVITVLFVYLISKTILKKSVYLPYIAAVMTACTPGLIQSAHFGTTESFLSCFFIGSVYFSMTMFDATRDYIRIRIWRILFLCMTIGLALGSKLTGLFFLIPPFLALLFPFLSTLHTTSRYWILGNKKTQKKHFLIDILIFILIGLCIVCGSLFFGGLSSPFNIVAPTDFKNSVFGYEKDVATGAYEAFYTRQFVATTPVLFQTEKVFPYALGWPLFIIGAIGFFIVCISIILSILRNIRRIRKHIPKNLPINWEIGLLLIIPFLAYGLPNAFLFAKWTRFMTPIFPFFAIFTAVVLQILSVKLNSVKNLNFRFPFFILIFSFFIFSLPGLAFMSIYTHEDSRVQASRWIYKNIPKDSYILFETGNVIDIPLGLADEETKPYTGISFDYYHLDENPELFSQLIMHLEKADYIFIPSRRIFANYPRIPEKYPLVTRYYDLLYSGKLGFEKVIEFHSHPSLFGLEFNDEMAEETSTVFDHPVIRIYKKVRPQTQDQYRLLFQDRL